MTNASTAASCAECPQRDACFQKELGTPIELLEPLAIRRVRVKRGDRLFRDGDAFHAIFTVRSGFFKTSLATESGHEQVTGFQMAGEILGLDGIVTERHVGDAVALEDSDVCAIPYARLSELAREVPAIQQHLHKAMSREIVREHHMLLLLGSMSARERLATFLLNLATRLQARGFSGSELVLRMTRAEIGSYLGMKLETVSRIFSKLTLERILKVHQRHVCIADAARLRCAQDERTRTAPCRAPRLQIPSHEGFAAQINLPATYRKHELLPSAMVGVGDGPARFHHLVQ